MATYRVERGTKRPHPRPMVREEDIGKHQYFNEKINQSQLTQYQIEMKANTLSEKAVDFGKSENKPIFDVINNSCDMTILTSGITHQTEIPHFEKNNSMSKKNKNAFISFACTTHLDNCDKLHGASKQHFISKCKKNSYMNLFLQMLPCGLPTTCLYKHIWVCDKLKEEYDIVAFFEHDQLGIVHFIEDCTACTFLGFAYAHSTPICYLVKKIVMFTMKRVLYL